jgi:DNA sulfur modification protein DndB
MSKHYKETNWTDLISGSKLTSAKRSRNSNWEHLKCSSLDKAENEKKGFSAIRTINKGETVVMQKEKDVGSIFEDRVWSMFAALGFTTLNESRTFTIVYGEGKHQQIDVFAVDDETAVVVECKAAATPGNRTFKKEIEAFGGQKQELTKVVQAQFPGRRVGFIWARSNIFSNEDKNRLKGFGITLFEEDTVMYFKELASHLGSCAKYQFLARLFANDPIPNFDPVVPAVKCRLGNHECFSFSIEPSRLLKIGYILHHHFANDEMLPTYQRLIKKKRLQTIRKYVESGGFFPNSLIICLKNDPPTTTFKRLDNLNGKTEVGLLTLPSLYQSAYIIDGQHRLYAYAGSLKAESETIPVVAFVDLAQSEQLQMFMDINENQKAVPKALRVTLNADMLWNASNPEDKRIAIASKIAQQLEDNKKSPLHGRIIVGENEPSPRRKVTVTAIQGAILKSGFLNSYSKNGTVIKERGLLDHEDSKKTYETLYDFFDLCFDRIKETCKTEWDLSDEADTILVTNRGIQAIIRLSADILRYLVDKNCFDDDIQNQTPEDLATAVIPFFDSLCEFFIHVEDKKRKELRTSLGGSADNKFLREFQLIVQRKHQEFRPTGLEEYVLNETKQFNAQASEKCSAIETAVKSIADQYFSSKKIPLEDRLLRFPKRVYDRIKREQNAFEYEKKHVDWWTLVSLEDCLELFRIADIWPDVKSHLSPPWEKKSSSAKKLRHWMEVVVDIKSKLSKPAFSVSKDQFDNVAKIYAWICGKDQTITT